MARLHEYQGEAILAANGFKIPRGRSANAADEAVVAAGELKGEVVIKIQAWTTGRAGIGGVAFAKKPEEARAHAERMLSMKVGQFPVEMVLVEEKIAIERSSFFPLRSTTRPARPSSFFRRVAGPESRSARPSRNKIDGPTNSRPDGSDENKNVIHQRLHRPPLRCPAQHRNGGRSSTRKENSRPRRRMGGGGLGRKCRQAGFLLRRQRRRSAGQRTGRKYERGDSRAVEKDLEGMVSGSWKANRVEVADSGDMAWVSGTFDWVSKDASGKKVTDHGKYLEVFQKQADGSWKCTADCWNSDLSATP